jgi:hypothetical protein
MRQSENKTWLATCFMLLSFFAVDSEDGGEIFFGNFGSLARN